MSAGQVTRLLEESRWLSGLARRLVKDPSLADDLAQDTLLAAIKAKRQPDPESTRGWLATILRRKVIGQKRADARRGHREQVAARSEALPSTEELSALLESERLLRDALEGLKEPYRRAVMLRYREGLSAAEIARRDGEPSGTVRSRVRSGLEMLRAQLEERDHAWAMTLIPLASLPSGAAPVAVKAAATTSTSIGTYLVGAAAVALVAVPLAWSAMGSTTEPAATLVAAATVDAVEASQPVHVAEAADASPAQRVELVAAPMQTTAAAVPKEAAQEIVPGVIELTVVDGDGLPISGAYAERLDDDHHVRYSEESGTDGRLTIAPPKQRRQIQQDTILVRAPGWAAAQEEMTFRAGTTSSKAEVILSPSASVHGTVHDPAGTNKQFIVTFVSPLPEDLKAQLLNGARLRDISDELKDLEFHGAFASTDPDSGQFKLTDVAVGTKGQVMALHDDDGGRIGWSDVVELKAGPPIELDPIVILTPAPKEGIPAPLEVVAVEAPAAEPTTIEVVDASGDPVESFKVELFQHRYGGAAPAMEPLSSVVGSDGSASFTPPLDTWRLRVASEDAVAELGPFDDGTFDGPRLIRLAPSVTYRGSIERSGQPWAGATLSLRSGSTEDLFYLTGELRSRANPVAIAAEVVAGSDGSFAFPAVKAGSYVIGVHSKGVMPVAFEVDATAELTLVAPGTGSLSGVVQANFGELAGGVVTVSHELGLRRSVAFGSDGVFQFDDLPEGSWRLGETYWPYDNKWLGEAQWDQDSESRQGPSYGYTNQAVSAKERVGVDVLVTAGSQTTTRLSVQTERPVELTGTIHVNGRRTNNGPLHFQREPWGSFTNLKDQRWLSRGSKGQFNVTLPAPGRWRVSSPLDDWGSKLWAEFNVAEGSPTGPLEINFETGTLVLTGVSHDHPFNIVVKGKASPEFQLGARQLLLNGPDERRVFRNLLAGEVQVIFFSKGPEGGATPVMTGILEPGATLEIDVSQ